MLRDKGLLTRGHVSVVACARARRKRMDAEEIEHFKITLEVAVSFQLIDCGTANKYVEPNDLQLHMFIL